MKKVILGGLAAAAVIAPIALTAGSASAAETCQTVATTTGPATFHATQPSGGGGNWVHNFHVNVTTDGSFTNGSNTIVGLDGGQTVTVTETVDGQTINNKVTLAATRPSGLYTFSWSVKDAPMDGVENSMTDGTVSYVTAQDWNGGELPITFTPLVFDTPTTQVCTTTPDPVDKNTHGEYVSGAAHAGVKGKDLAAIAKDKTKVGPYKG
jgi:hypothetical protein